MANKTDRITLLTRDTLNSFAPDQVALELSRMGIRKSATILKLLNNKERKAVNIELKRLRAQMDISIPAQLPQRRIDLGETSIPEVFQAAEQELAVVEQLEDPGREERRRG